MPRSKEELKQIFTLNTGTRCETHDILVAAARKAAAVSAPMRAKQAAGVGGGKEDPAVAAAAAVAAEFRDVSDSCIDAPLRAAIGAGCVTWVHQVSQPAGAAALLPAKARAAPSCRPRPPPPAVFAGPHAGCRHGQAAA